MAGENSTRNYLLIENGKIVLDQWPPTSYTLEGGNVAVGEWIHVAVVRNGSDQALYIDGELVASNSSAETYSGLTPNEVAIGRRLGSSNNSPFAGEMDELRIWSTPRSQSEIAENRFHNLNGDEAGLYAYYNFDAAAGTGRLTERSGNGPSGILTNSDPASDWTDSGRSITYDVQEDVTTGTTVANAFGFDPDGDALTYSIVSGNDAGAFALNASTGALTTSDDSQIDYESTTTYTLQIEVSDGSLSDTYEIVLNIQDVNEAPVLANNEGLTLNEGATSAVTTSELQVTDHEQGASDLAYTVTGVPSNGELKLNSDVLSTGDTFTQDDINSNRISYVHDNGLTTSDSFDFSFSDGTTSITDQTFNITVSAQNDAPALAVNDGITLDEGATETITTVALQVTDEEEVAADLTYSVVTVPVNGNLKLNGTPLSASDTFTQDDIDNSRLSYGHDGSETTSDSFRFTVSDGNGGSVGTTTFSITVTPQNDAPVLVTNDGLEVDEGDTGTITNTKLGVTDAEEPASAIVFTLTSIPSSGLLKLTGTALGASDTFTQEDLDNNRLTYEHDGTETTSDNFQFTVSDDAGGSIGTTTFPITINRVDEAQNLVVFSGNNQSKVVTGSLDDPLVVRVTDGKGSPEAGITVNFAFGTVPSGATGQSLTATSATTDANGQASTGLTLGDGAGTYEVTATVSGLTDVTFTAEAIPGSATQLAFIGQLSDAEAGDALSPDVTVRLLDTNSNPVDTDGVNVTLAISGEATLGGTLTQPTVDGVATFDDLYVIEPGTGYTLTATSGLLDNDQSTGFDISRRPLTITVDAASKTYGDDDPVLSYQVTSGALITGVDLSGALVRVAGKDVGTYAITQNDLTNANNPSYDITFVSKDLEITPRELTLSDFTASAKVYDATTAAEVSFDDDRLSGDELEFDFTAVFNNTSVEDDKPVSITGITINGGADAGNYSLATTSGAATADVTPAPLTVINAVAQDKAYDGTDVATITGAALSGVIGTDEVTLENAATGTFAQTAAGTDIAVTTTMTLGGADAGNYSLSQPAGLKADITNTVPTVTAWPAASDITYGQALSASALSGGTAAVSGTFAFVDDTVEPGSAGTYSADVIFTPDDLSNYSTVTNQVEVSVLTKELTITSATAQNKVYDGTSEAILTGAALNGVINGDDVTLTGAGEGTFAQSDVGAGIAVTTTMGLSGADAGNYHLSQPAGLTADITTRELAISGSFTASDKVYDGAVAAALDDNSLSLTGVVGGETVGLTAVEIEFISPEVASNIDVTIQSAALSGTDAGNYTLLLAGAPTATASITRKVLTVTGSFTVKNKEYDGTASATLDENNLALSGMIAGDEVGLSPVAEFEDESVGPGKTVSLIATSSLTGADAGNYSLSLAGAPTTLADITAGVISASRSTVVATTPHVADGVDAATITITLADANGNAIEGVAAGDFTLEVGENAEAGAVNETDVPGTYEFTLTNTVKEALAVKVSVRGIALQDEPEIAFEAGPPALLVFTGHPVTSVAGDTLTGVAVEVRDAQGNVVTEDPDPVATEAVTVAFADGANEEGATLMGTATVAVDWTSGTAVFDDLSITKTGGYRLEATVNVAGVDAGESADFDILPGTAVRLAFTDQPKSTASGQVMETVAVQLRDMYDNDVKQSDVPVSLSISNEATLNGALSAVTDAEGLALFSDLSVSEAGVGYTLSAIGENLTGATSDLFDISAGEPAQMKVHSGNNQSQMVADTLEQPLQVLVADLAGNPVSGAEVNFVLSAQPVGSDGAKLLATEVVTNAEGLAFTPFVLGTIAGNYEITAASGALNEVVFAVTGLPGAADPANALISADPDTLTADGTSTTTVTVQLKDRYGNALTSGGAVVALEATAGMLSELTDLGNGTYTAVFTAPSETGSAVISGTLNNEPMAEKEEVAFVAGAPAELLKVSGNGQTGPAGEELEHPLVVRVVDANGHSVADVEVEFTVKAAPAGATGQKLSSSTLKTDANGEASIRFTPGDKSGRYTVAASAGSLEEVVFELVAESGRVAKLIKLSGDNQVQPTLSWLGDSLVVRLLDRFDNPVAGQAVVFALATQPDQATSAAINPDTAYSNEDGIAFSRVRLGDLSGDYIYSATMPDQDTDSVTFTANALFSRPNPSFIDTVNTVVFDGSINTFMYAEPNSTLDELEELTIEIWVLPNSLTDYYELMSKGDTDNQSQSQFSIWGEGNSVFAKIYTQNGQSVQVRADDFFQLVNDESTQSKSKAAAEDEPAKYEWTHLAFSVDSNNNRIYLYKNGFPVSQASFEGTLNQGSARLKMGAGLDGEIHEVRVWDRVQSLAMIQARMAKLLEGTEENLVLYHTFDDATTEKDEDLTNNGNHLFMNGDVELNFSVRGIPDVETLEDQSYIMAFKGLNEHGGKLSAVITGLPAHGTLYQLTDNGQEIGEAITASSVILTDPENRAYYVPNRYYNGQDQLGYKLVDEFGNAAETIRNILIHPVNNEPAISFGDVAGFENNKIDFNQRDTLIIDLTMFTEDVDNTPGELEWSAEVTGDYSGGSSRQGKIVQATAHSRAAEHPSFTSRAFVRQKAVDDPVAANKNPKSVGRAAESLSYRIHTTGNPASGYRTKILQYNAETQALDSLVIEVDNTRYRALITTTPLFYASDIPVRFTVQDAAGESDSDTLWVTVHKVNAAPAPFRQLVPAENDTVALSDINKQVVFRWEKSADLEGEEIEYLFSIWDNEGGREVHEGLTDTTLTLNLDTSILDFDKAYRWRVLATDKTDTTQSAQEMSLRIVKDLPLLYRLSQNYPNPFNMQSDIQYWVPVDSRVVIILYDILGRKVKVLVDREVETGFHKVTLNVGELGLASGVYIYRMVAEGHNPQLRFVRTQKLTIIR